MKAKFFLLGLCALALAACSIDEVSQVNDTNAVTFKATTATRAAATTTNNLQSFTVWAWNGTTEFMDGVTATKSGNVFTTSPLYFWPTGTVDFYALSPAAEVVGIEDGTEYAYLGGKLNTEGDDEGNGWTYTGNVAKAKIEKDNIVIDAVIPGSYEDQIDLVYAVTKEQSSGSVPMNFRHALSQVVFKASNTNSELTININGVSVCSVFKEGTYYVPTVNTTTNLPTDDLGTGSVSDSQGYWDTEAHKARFAAGIDTTTLTGISDPVTLTSSDGALMLLPQEVEAWDVLADAHDTELGSYFRISCSIFEDGAQLWPNANETDEYGEILEYADIAIPCDIDWAEGYRYTYTFIFGDGAGYYPPDDPNYDLDGTPILVPVTFTVSVDEFQNAGNKDVSTDTDVVVYNAKDLIAAVNQGLSPIEIAGDITLEDTYLKITQDTDITIDEGCTLTIDATVNGSWCAFYVTNGTLNLYGDGEIVYDGVDDETNNFYAIWINGTNAVANVYGCTIEGHPDCVYAQTGYANIYGGTFYGTATYRDEYWLLNCYDSNYKNGTANIYVYGGTYQSFDPANNVCEGTGTNFCAEGYGTVSSTDSDGNTWFTVVKTTVATPADLMALVEAGASEITLDADIALDATNLFFGSDCELNLNGHTLTGVDLADDEMPCGNGANSVIFITGGTLTVTGPGTITTEGSGTDGNGGTGSGDTSVFWLDGGDLVINGGTYNGGSWKDTTGSDYAYSSATVYVTTGFAYIYDGTFTCGVAKSFNSDGWKTKEGYTECIINIYDASRKTDPKTGWAYVYGGEYRNFDPANNPCEGANTNFCAEGYASDDGVVDADGNTWFTVTAE